MIKVHLRALSRRIATDEPTRRMLAVAGYLAFTLLLPLVFHDLAPMLLLPAGAAFLWLAGLLRDPSGARPLADTLSLKPLTSGQPAMTALALIGALAAVALAAEGTRRGLDFFGIHYREEQELVRILKHSGTAERFFIGVVAVVLAPVGEEIVFRKVIFDLLRPAGIASAVILSSALFAVLHFHLVGVVALGLLGAILQLLFLKTDNLWCPIQAHAAFNLLTFIAASAAA